MICFLTSSPIAFGSDSLDPSNRFVEELRRRFPENCRALFVCSSPDTPERTDGFAATVRQSMEKAGFAFSLYRVLDGRNAESAFALVHSSDLLILAGGHVPTQNAFFRRIGLKEALRDYAGLVLGISAGSMNSAELVYAQPEEEGEAVDPAYSRFLPGLGLTKTMLLPHYQMVKDAVLDGLRLFADVTLPDSLGRTFYAIPDGSYLLIEDGRETLRGEAYEIRDGRMRPVSAVGGELCL